MFKKSFFILVFFWALSLSAGVGYLFWQAKEPNMQILNREVSLILVQESSKSNFKEAILNRLPELFSYEPALVSLFLTDLDDNLLGSMFDQSRLPEAKYLLLQRRFNEVVEKGLGGNYVLTKLNSRENKINIYLVFKDPLSYTQLYQKIYQNQRDAFYWLALYAVFGISLILFFMLWALLTGFKKKKLSKRSNSVGTIPSGMLPNMRNTTSKIIGNDEFSSPLFSGEENMTQTLRTLARQTSADRVVFYSYQPVDADAKENYFWHPVAMLTGNLITKGEGVKSVPEFLLRTGDDDNSEQKEIFIDEVQREAVCLLRQGHALLGAFLFQFSRENFSELDEENLLRLTQEFNHSVSVQRTFEKAVLDEGMELYTYPYFFFAVKEKLEAGGNFYTFILRIEGYQNKGKAVWQRWNHFRDDFFKSKILYLPTCAWFEDDRILLNLDEHKFESKEQMIEICRDFVLRSQNITASRIHAALLQVNQNQFPNGYKMEAFVRMLIQALQKAETSGELVIASRQKLQPIA